MADLGQYAHYHCDPDANVLRLSCSGSTGYGRFTVEEWTDMRTMVLHPAREPPYLITSKLARLT